MARKKIRFDFDNPWAKKNKSYMVEGNRNFLQIILFKKKNSLNQKQNFFD